jgi:Ca-activated chloride channel homolog
MAERRNSMAPVRIAGFVFILLVLGGIEWASAHGTDRPVTQGTLLRMDKEGRPAGECPLKHTAVRADITGFLGRVTVTQEFENRSSDRIEAVYTFPLPQHAAVDDMEMNVGGRIIRGLIKRREEARQIYEQARQRGQTAALLDQERPNIFTQSVTNIAPGAQVKITISYLETLRYEEGWYEFVFPMVVGPRYIPGQASGQQGGGWSSDTDRVPDASRITPPVTPPGTRTGHDIDIEVKIDAGFPIDQLESVGHEILSERRGLREVTTHLRDQATLPNKDFILRYNVAKDLIQDALFVHRGPRGGFFTLVVQPPERPRVEEVTPKELVFVLDTSGSMSGFPIEKAKETMRLALAGLYPRDTFNLITFAGDTQILFPAPVAATAENLRQAYEFMAQRHGGGGTEMMKAIRAALEPSGEKGKVRIVCFMTDGYVGNDMEIVGEVRRYPDARVFAFGIGNSVNRFLLDGMAREGRGEVEYVSLNEDGSAAARRFHERVRQPLLTDIQLDFGWLPVKDVHPGRLPDLFAAKPLVVTGRFTGSARGALRLTGRQGSRQFSRTIDVTFPEAEPRNESLASLWARGRVEDLSAQDWGGLQSGSPRAALKEEITNLGLEFRIMTPFTSFVAVEERVVTEGGNLRRVQVPVEMPEGVSYEGVFGSSSRDAAKMMSPMAAAPTAGFIGGIAGSSVVGGVPGGVVGGVLRESRMAPPKGNAQSISPAMRDEKADSNRLHAQVQAWIEEVRAGRRAGEVQVEILLTAVTPEILAKLKQLGFHSTTPSREERRLVGRIAAEKLELLVRLPEVLYLAPSGK